VHESIEGSTVREIVEGDGPHQKP